MIVCLYVTAAATEAATAAITITDAATAFAILKDEKAGRSLLSKIFRVCVVEFVILFDAVK